MFKLVNQVLKKIIADTKDVFSLYNLVGIEMAQSLNVGNEMLYYKNTSEQNVASFW